METVSLEGLLTKFSRRVSKLPIEFQRFFLEDLETAIENRLKVFENAN